MLVILIVIVAAIALLLVVASMKPNNFEVSSSVTIEATSDKISPYIEDYRKWELWSPFEKLDPQIKRIYSGSESGVGAKYRWEGNNKAGVGEMQIIESTPGAKVIMKLDFMKPFAAHNIGEFTMQPDGQGTKVTWLMKGPRPFIGKVMNTIMNIDKMIGSQFEEGLRSLKAKVEE